MDYARKYLSETHLSSGSPPSSRPLPVAEPPESVAVESDFVIILAALLCALICVVGLIAVARCAWLRRGVSGGGAASVRSANKGLKKKVLNSLPKYTYKSDSKKVAAAETAAAAAEEVVVVVVEECAICLTEYIDGDEIRVLPHCGHRFHVQCIDTWLGSHSSCPSCRSVLVQNRCRKCGEYPTMSSASVAGGGGGGYTFVKPSQVCSTAPSTSSPTFLV